MHCIYPNSDNIYCLKNYPANSCCTIHCYFNDLCDSSLSVFLSSQNKKEPGNDDIKLEAVKQLNLMKSLNGKFGLLFYCETMKIRDQENPHLVPPTKYCIPTLSVFYNGGLLFCHCPNIS